MYVTRAKRRLGEVVRRDGRAHASARWRLAHRHLRGTGLEIGALHKPLRVPRSVDVRYVDRFDVAQLRAHYPELADLPLVPVDVVDDGERLATVPDESVDFVIANHFYEHCEDPIATLENHARVTRPGGTLYIAIPDKRFTFDRPRPVTTLAHVTRDNEEGPEWSRTAHYEEWSRDVSSVLNSIPPDKVADDARMLEEIRYSIHFHVWTPNAWLELLTHCARNRGLPLEIVAAEQNGHEFITVLARA